MKRSKRANGEGSITADGYITHWVDGAAKLEHVLMAESILGKPLPTGAVVHHVDGDGQNNRPENLVICESNAYHKLLHQRTRSLNAGVPAYWRKCTICKVWDDPEKMRIRSRKCMAHRVCDNRRQRENYRRRVGK